VLILGSDTSTQHLVLSIRSGAAYFQAMLDRKPRECYHDPQSRVDNRSWSEPAAYYTGMDRLWLESVSRYARQRDCTQDTPLNVY